MKWTDVLAATLTARFAFQRGSVAFFDAAECGTSRRRVPAGDEGRPHPRENAATAGPRRGWPEHVYSMLLRYDDLSGAPASTARCDASVRRPQLPQSNQCGVGSSGGRASRTPGADTWCGGRCEVGLSRGLLYAVYVDDSYGSPFLDTACAADGLVGACAHRVDLLLSFARAADQPDPVF